METVQEYIIIRHIGERYINTHYIGFTDIDTAIDLCKKYVKDTTHVFLINISGAPKMTIKKDSYEIF